MTIIASLLFLTALGASIGVITLSIRNAMPRIREVIDMEFAPAMQRERRIILGDMRRLAPAYRCPQCGHFFFCANEWRMAAKAMAPLP